MPSIDCAIQPAPENEDNWKTVVVIATLMFSLIFYRIKRKFSFLKRSRSAVR